MVDDGPWDAGSIDSKITLEHVELADLDMPIQACRMVPIHCMKAAGPASWSASCAPSLLANLLTSFPRPTRQTISGQQPRPGLFYTVHPPGEETDIIIFEIG